MLHIERETETADLKHIPCLTQEGLFLFKLSQKSMMHTFIVHIKIAFQIE